MLKRLLKRPHISLILFRSSQQHLGCFPGRGVVHGPGSPEQQGALIAAQGAESCSCPGKTYFHTSEKGGERLQLCV